MSTYSLSQVKDDLSGLGHGTSVGKITNINALFRRSASNLLGKINPEETRRIKQITLYDGVTDYAAEADMKDKAIIDLRPQSNRSASDNARKKFSQDFDREKLEDWVTVMDDSATKYLRIIKSLSPAALTLDALNDDSGWAATAVAQNLVEEDIIFEDGALQFGISGSGTGYIESSSIDSQDLTDYDEKSSAFLEFYIPTAAALALITSITLRWGNSSTVYWSKTVTAQHLGSLRVGRNLLRFDWNGATETGTVDPAAIDYARISVVATGAISGLIVSNLFFSVGKIWDIEYYSKHLFRTSAGVWSDVPTNDEDLINLDTASYNLFLFECGLAAAQQRKGADAASDREYFKATLFGDAQEPGLYKEYESRNPDQTLKPQAESYSLRSFKRK